MPAPDGFAVCRQMRRADAAVPILMVSGRSAVLDEVRALDAGADGYLTKPFDPLSLLARLSALARRTGPVTEASPPKVVHHADVTVGDLAIDLAGRTASLRGVPVALTPTEWVLLEQLARHAGQIIPHQDLVARVWGTARAGNSRSLKVYMNRLRQKLGDDVAVPRYIETRRNQGYRLANPAV
jgi:DNA-binding response OmpR family regulator